MFLCGRKKLDLILIIDVVEMIFCVKKYESVISLSSKEKKVSANICILRCEIHDYQIDHYIFIKKMELTRETTKEKWTRQVYKTRPYTCRIERLMTRS